MEQVKTKIYIPHFTLCDNRDKLRNMTNSVLGVYKSYNDAIIALLKKISDEFNLKLIINNDSNDDDSNDDDSNDDDFLADEIIYSCDYNTPYDLEQLCDRYDKYNDICHLSIYIYTYEI